jgi:two-component system chemotaxis response regulator CheY
VTTILVVDDESNMRFLLRMILETAGYEVAEAPHGAAALERARESRPDLIVTDLMMPVMGGHELIERLRAEPATAGVPIVVVSANPRAALPEADARIGKPFDADALLETIRTLTENEAA